MIYVSNFENFQAYSKLTIYLFLKKMSSVYIYWYFWIGKGD